MPAQPLRRPAPSLTGDELFRALVEHGFEGINLLDAEGRCSIPAPATTGCWDTSPDEIDGKSGFAFAHPDDLANAAQMWRQMLENPQQVFTSRIRVRHKDGRWRWTEATVRNLLHVPAVRGVVVNWRDVTEQHLAESELQRTAYLLRAVADGTTDAVFVKDWERQVSAVQRSGGAVRRSAGERGAGPGRHGLVRRRERPQRSWSATAV